MKKARLLLPVLLLLVSPMTAQVEHAPTPEQCRVDADAWGVPKWAVFAPNENEFANLSGAMMHDQIVSAKSLEARNAAFGQCEKTDNVQSSRYAQAARAYAIAELGRMADFMERHSLTGQFYQEDEQGKR
ncbi:MAG: hypothetical protein WCA19_07675 [Candidatus Acidiferrales bacterium]